VKALALGAGLFLLGCSTSLIVDPEGLKCDVGGVCPNGFVCRDGVCHQTGGAGGGSSGSGGGGSNSCAGVVCNQPPAPQCASPDTQRSFTSPGACNAATGSCDYTFTEKTCTAGCTNGLCVGDPCNGVSCTTPPAAKCKDASTLITYANAGSCSSGQCSYPSTEIACTSACTMGACQGQNLCLNVTCNMPPMPSCVGTNTLRTFMSPGSCNMGTGQCSYNPIDLVCVNGCAGGACITPGQSFTQTMPRLRFGVKAIDQAPGSTGNHVVVVGDNGNIMKWDGATFTRVTAVSATTANFNSVWFANANTAYAVGSGKSVIRYSGTSSSYASVAGVPGSATQNLIAVHGKDESNFTIIDGVGNFARYSNGWGPASAAPGGLGVTHKMTGVYIDPQNRLRISGQRSNGLSTYGVVLYAGTTGNLIEDSDNGTGQPSDGFGAVGGPAFNGGTASPDVAFVGRLNSNGLRHHNVMIPEFDGTFSPPVTLPSGAGITGITGATGSRAVYFLESPTSASAGHLYRYSGLTGLDPAPLADFYFDKVSMGANESGGVVIAEADLTNGVNNIYRRNANGGEMLDLGENWAAVTAGPAGALILVSKDGDLAMRPAGSATWQFRRGPLLPALDATATNGASVLVVGSGGRLEKFIPGTSNPTVTPIITPTSSDLRSVCRVSDTEAYAAGNSGSLLSINTTAATAATMLSPTMRDLASIDCPSAGAAVACGESGTLLRLISGAWVPVTPALPSTVDLTTCKLVGTTLWVAGDGAFYKMDLSATAPTWQSLTPQVLLSQLVVISPNEVYALSAKMKVVRFDGTTWTTRFTLNTGALLGGGQVAGKVVYAGSLGVVVEGQ
jgi:hypothetical protein